MQVDYKEAWNFLKESDNIYILTHKSPDGDTLGSGFGLANILNNLGKNVNVFCSDDFPKRYDFLYKEYKEKQFEPQVIVSVDLADVDLFGDKLIQYKDKVDLCIDHHISNTFYAKRTLLNSDASAACEVIFQMLHENNVEIDIHSASCLYTGIATDTGCFKYKNTTKQCHMAVAELIGLGVNIEPINRKMFDVKSKARIKVEQHVISNIEYYLDDRIALVAICKDLIQKSGIEESEFEGLASLTLQAEGVEVGITMKEKEDNVFKVSMRAVGDINVSEICQIFGGGGHVKAAGCIVNGTLSEAKNKIIDAVTKSIEG